MDKLKICSACLLGLKTRYDGKTKPEQTIIGLLEEETLIPVCPEQLGGLSTPRDQTELTNDGKEIIRGKGKAITRNGRDMTSEFIKGAKEVYKIAKKLDINEAILKQRSPSCGNGEIYDGTFTNTTTKGDGVAAAFLKHKGIRVISEEEIK